MGDSKVNTAKNTNSQEEKGESFKTLVLENEEALEQCMVIIRALHETGILKSARTILQPKEATKEIELNLINSEQTAKIFRSLSTGLTEADQSIQDDKIKIFDLLQLLNDPDVNRAVRYLIYFLKGIGKELKEK